MEFLRETCKHVVYCYVHVMLCNVVHVLHMQVNMYCVFINTCYCTCREVIEFRERTMCRWYKQGHPDPKKECIDRRKRSQILTLVTYLTVLDSVHE